MSILRSLSRRARVGEPPTASTFTSPSAKPPALAMSATKKVVPSCMETTPMVLPLRSASALISRLRDDEMRRPLGDAGDDPELTGLVGIGDDAFDRGDADLVSAGAQVVKDFFRRVIDLDLHVEAFLLEETLP